MKNVQVMIEVELSNGWKQQFSQTYMLDDDAGVEDVTYRVHEFNLPNVDKGKPTEENRASGKG